GVGSPARIVWVPPGRPTTPLGGGSPLRLAQAPGLCSPQRRLQSGLLLEIHLVEACRNILIPMLRHVLGHGGGIQLAPGNAEALRELISRRKEAIGERYRRLHTSSIPWYDHRGQRSKTSYRSR